MIVTAGQTLATLLDMTGNVTIAAAHGKVVTPVAASTAWALRAPTGISTLNIGDGANDGTVVWNTGAGSTVVNLGNCFVEVHAGTFRAGDDSFGFLLENVAGTTVDSGATLDLASFGASINDLAGAGSVTAHGGAQIELEGANFSGVISGVASLIINDGVVLSGDSTYTQGTTIDPSSVLALGNGGTTGSVLGNITDNGGLIYDHSNNPDRGRPDLGQRNCSASSARSVLTIDRAESYTGGTFVTNGRLSIDRASAIGTGNLNLNGGEFLTTTTVSLTNRLTMSGNVTIAAATGTQLKFGSATGWNLDATAPTTLTFGDGTHNGTILFTTPGGSGITNTGHYAVDIHSGVLKAGDSSLGFLLADDASGVTIDSGATLNIAGFQNDKLVNLTGTGQLTNSTGHDHTLHHRGRQFRRHDQRRAAGADLWRRGDDRQRQFHGRLPDRKRLPARSDRHLDAEHRLFGHQHRGAAQSRLVFRQYRGLPVGRHARRARHRLQQRRVQRELQRHDRRTHRQRRDAYPPPHLHRRARGEQLRVCL